MAVLKKLWRLRVLARAEAMSADARARASDLNAGYFAVHIAVSDALASPANEARSGDALDNFFPPLAA